MRFRVWIYALTAALLSVRPGVADWPTFRGSDRSGVSPDKGLLKEWPENGPKLIWEAKGAGNGYASPAIAQGKIITLGDGPSTASDKEEYLTCFDLKTGEPLWKSKVGEKFVDDRDVNWGSARSTPTISGDLVYVITPYGVLLCCKLSDGSEVWSKDLKKEFGGEKADSWGFSESPLVDGDRVVCTPGNEKATMVALDKKTGDTIWMASRPGDIGAGHASIVISNAGGVKTYINTTGSGVLGVRASDGKVMWTTDFGKKIIAVIPTVILKEDYVFVPVGYKKGGALFKQIPGESGEVKIEEVYDFQTKLANKHGGVVLIGDYLYGDSDDAGNPYCADLKTGAIKWQERGPAGKGSIAITAADGCLYMRCQNGTMALVAASPDALKVLSTFKIPGSGKSPSWAHPVIDDGKLYLREGDSILCYDLKG